MKKLLLLSFFFVHQSCNNSQQKVDYNVSTPSGWTRIDTLVDKRPIAFFKSPTNDVDSFMENINIQRDDRIGKVDLEQYYQQYRTKLYTELDQVKTISITEMRINGIDFKNLKCSYIYQGVPLSGDIYFTVYKRTGFMITCTTLRSTMTEWQPVYNNFLRSFSFK